MTEKDVDRLLGAYYARRLARGDGLYGNDDELAETGDHAQRDRVDTARADAVRADAVRADAVRADAVRADAVRADAVRADARLTAALAAAALVMMLGFGAVGSTRRAEDAADGGLVASMRIEIEGTPFAEAIVAIGESWPRGN